MELPDSIINSPVMLIVAFALGFVIAWLIRKPAGYLKEIKLLEKEVKFLRSKTAKLEKEAVTKDDENAKLLSQKRALQTQIDDSRRVGRGGTITGSTFEPEVKE